MSPVTVKVKRPHYGGLSNLESEAVEALASFEDGVTGPYIVEEGK